MSVIQQNCIILLGIADFVFNFMGWLYISMFCVDMPRPKFLFASLIATDIVTGIILILGAIGVFG